MAPFQISLSPGRIFLAIGCIISMAYLHMQTPNLDYSSIFLHRPSNLPKVSTRSWGTTHVARQPTLAELHINRINRHHIPLRSHSFEGDEKESSFASQPLLGFLASGLTLVVAMVAMWCRYRRPVLGRNPPMTPLALTAFTGTKSRFPTDYGDILRFSVRAVSQMLNDKVRFIEIDFPVASLSSVFGDAEGGVEMTKSAQFVAQFTRSLPPDYKAIRVYFPDEQEATRHKDLFQGQDRIRVDFLTRPTGLSEVGWDIFKRSAKKMFKDDDELFVVAYPSFNPNEMMQVRELADADDLRRPIVVINGELDRIRTGYYPAFFYPRLQKAMAGFLPNFDQALYIHNYKGTRGGALYRVYPEPWQVFRRTADQLKLVYEQEKAPTSREVSLDILPRYPDP